MTKLRDYPDRTTHRKRSALPTALQKDIVVLSRVVYGGGDVEPSLSNYVASIKSLPGSAITAAEWEIPDIGGLYREPAIRTGIWPFSRKTRSARSTALEALVERPELSHLFIFHGDGHLREAALRNCSDTPESPFQFVALVYRLNDWVEQVRNAARERANSVFPKTSAEVVAEASLFLFTQMQQLKRWGDDECAILEAALFRPDVLEALANLLVQRHAGPLGRILRQALARPGLETFLPRLAREAAQPMVRAVSLETLIKRRARWQEGHEFRWIDKPYGIGRQVRKYAQRPVEHQLCIETLMREGSRDRAVEVRRAVARGLIDLRHELSPAMKEVGRQFLQDRSPAIREKAEFYLGYLPVS